MCYHNWTIRECQVIPLSDFICGTQRAKLMERLRALCDHFDRPCLIVEQERLKKDEKPRKPPWVVFNQ